MYQFLKNKVSILSFSLILFGLFTYLSAQIHKRSVDFTSSNLPIVIIDTHEQAIPYDDPRIVADMDIIFNGVGQRNNISDPANDYSGKISIEIRGQSSAGWDKKSYGLETQNDDGNNRNVSILGLPEENDWILYAPYYDRSLMRNVLTYHLAREMGWYASRTVYCELVLNGEYQGIYVLMEKIKRDKNRVDIAKLNPDEISGDDVTGGYILRVDKEPWNAGFDSPYPPFEGSTAVIRYQYLYPKDDDIVPEQEAYIQGFMYAFENLMHDGDYSDPVLGYAKYLNVNSFIDYVILNELSRNVDGYRLSAYFYKEKDSDGGKLSAGPVWDYNFSFGNAGYYDSWIIEGWQLLYFADDYYFHQVDGFQMPFWWRILFTDEVFASKLILRWQELRQDILNLDSIYTTMDRFADTTAEARVRNFEIWPRPGATELGGGWFPSDPRSSQISSYADELALTKSWIADHIEWMDENIPLLTSLAHDTQPILPVSFELMQNYPNPFNPTTTIEYYIAKPSFVSIKVYNLLGEEIERLVQKFKTVGKHKINFDGNKYPSGIYFYELRAGGFISTKFMLLLR